MNAGHTSPARGSIARMTSRASVVVTLFALTLGGAAAACGNQPAEPGSSSCKVLSQDTRTETRPVTKVTDSGRVKYGTRSRTVTETASRCQGKVETEATYGSWSKATWR